MIFYENRLLADDSHEISYLIFSKIGINGAKLVVCCSDWRFKGLILANEVELIKENIHDFDLICLAKLGLICVLVMTIKN